MCSSDLWDSDYITLLRVCCVDFYSLSSSFMSRSGVYKVGKVDFTVRTLTFLFVFVCFFGKSLQVVLTGKSILIVIGDILFYSTFNSSSLTRQIT